MVGEGGGGGGGGGSKYDGHYKMTPPPNCRIQDVTSQALFVHLSGLFISFYFHAFNTKTLWLVKEAVVVVVGGGSKYYTYNILTRPILKLNLYIRAVPFVCLFLLLQNLRFKHHLYIESGAIMFNMLRMGQ